MTTQQIDREIRQKLHDAQKYAAGLELNLAAVIQRAEAAEKALADAQSRLLHTQAGLTIWMERSKSNAAEYNAAYDAMCDIAQMLDCAEDWAAIKSALKETLRAQLAECTCSYQRTDVQPKSPWCPDVKSPR